MNNILDRVAARSAYATSNQFTPANTQQFFALRLAAKLGESSAARHYHELSEQHSSDELLGAYQRSTKSNLDRAHAFHRELQSATPKRSSSSRNRRLIAIRLDRRAIAIAVFTNDRLKHADGFHLSTAEDKAFNTIATLLLKTLLHFPAEYAVLEASEDNVQRTRLHRAILDLLCKEAVSIEEILKRDVIEAFSHPPVRSRKELRQIVGSIFPVLGQVPGTPWTYDAAALGLYAQTERLFTINT